MKFVHFCAILSTLIYTSSAYSKYGRTCKDIGCLSSEVCVMETDPCSYYQRQNECGSFPTCKKTNSNEPPSCKKYVCPPTKVCRMDGVTPKCVDDHSKVNQVGYDTSAINNDGSAPSGQVYPNLPARGETTPRSNVGYQPPPGQGYQGGQIGSGYPGQARPGAYPQQPNGYPQQPHSGYPQYPQQGQQQPGGYNYNYGQQYPAGNNYYQGQGQRPGYNNPYGQQQPGYGQKSGTEGGIVDSITSALRKYGTNLLKDAISKKISGQQ